jgi:hypothetical protein
MAISILQAPNLINLAQTPTPYSIKETNADAYTSSSFQFVGELYIWKEGNLGSRPSTPTYTMLKYPNNSGSAIFDVSRIMTSEFTQLRAADSSSVVYHDMDFYIQYKESPSGSFITGSHQYSGAVLKAIDGYSVFQGSINAGSSDTKSTMSEFWPIMTSGPVSQSYLAENYGRMSCYVGRTADGGGGTALIYSSSAGPTENNNYLFLLTGSDNIDNQIATFPISPLEPDWPLDNDPDYIQNFEIYAISGSNNAEADNKLNTSLHFELQCTKKYPNVRIKWKNRFGQYDYFNFNLVSRETFQTQRSKYQPQIGSWDDTTLGYEDYESSIQNYITDSTLKLTVNTDYVVEEYNDTFKELMVSDEIYWVYEEGTDQTEKLRPLAIDDTSFNLKTGVVDKLIQYEFSFTQGQGFKLIF